MSGWYAKFYLPYRPAGFWFRGRFVGPDGKSIHVMSQESWSTRDEALRALRAFLDVAARGDYQLEISGESEAVQMELMS